MTTHPNHFKDANRPISLVLPMWAWDLVLSAARDQERRMTELGMVNSAASLGLAIQPAAEQMADALNAMTDED